MKVLFYSNETYQTLLAFIKTHCDDIIDVSSGKITKYLTSYEDYDIELISEQNSSARLLPAPVIQRQ